METGMLTVPPWEALQVFNRPAAAQRPTAPEANDQHLSTSWPESDKSCGPSLRWVGAEVH